jgi:hypothetical protein
MIGRAEERKIAGNWMKRKKITEKARGWCNKV